MSAEEVLIEDDSVPVMPEEYVDLPWHLLPPDIQARFPESSVQVAAEPETPQEPTDVLAEVTMLTPEEGEAVTADDGTEGHVGTVDPIPEFDGTITLTTGHVLNIRPIKTRQFLRLVKIIMQGAPHVLPVLVPESENFKGMLRVAIINAMGDAPDAVIDFIQGAVQIRPEDFVGKSQAERSTLIKEVEGALLDPEMDDTLSIIAGVIALDGDNLEALGKRVVEMAKNPPPR